MKLVVAVIAAEATGRVTQALSRAGFSCTQIASSGGFLGGGNTTLLIGVTRSQVDQVLRLIRAEEPDEGVAFVLRTQAGAAGVLSLPGVLEFPGRR